MLAKEEPRVATRPRTPHVVYDSFLAPEVAAAMLAQMIAAEDRFTPSAVRRRDESEQATDFRSSLRLPGRVGVDLAPLLEAVHARFDDLCAAAGLAPFAIHHSECSIVAHGEGDYYKPHVDTRLGAAPADVPDVRLLSCVYYLHALPLGFGGGALALHGFEGTDPVPVKIAPAHNRLAAFPSFLRHEVLPVTSPSGAFADRRFSVNVWLRKARAGAAA